MEIIWKMDQTCIVVKMCIFTILVVYKIILVLKLEHSLIQIN